MASSAFVYKAIPYIVIWGMSVTIITPSFERRNHVFCGAGRNKNNAYFYDKILTYHPINI